MDVRILRSFVQGYILLCIFEVGAYYVLVNEQQILENQIVIRLQT